MKNPMAFNDIQIFDHDVSAAIDLKQRIAVFDEAISNSVIDVLRSGVLNRDFAVSKIAEFNQAIGGVVVQVSRTELDSLAKECAVQESTVASSQASTGRNTNAAAIDRQVLKQKVATGDSKLPLVPGPVPLVARVVALNFVVSFIDSSIANQPKANVFAFDGRFVRFDDHDRTPSRKLRSAELNAPFPLLRHNAVLESTRSCSIEATGLRKYAKSCGRTGADSSQSLRQSARC